MYWQGVHCFACTPCLPMCSIAHQHTPFPTTPHHDHMDPHTECAPTFGSTCRPLSCLLLGFCFGWPASPSTGIELQVWEQELASLGSQEPEQEAAQEPTQEGAQEPATETGARSLQAGRGRQCAVWEPWLAGLCGGVLVHVPPGPCVLGPWMAWCHKAWGAAYVSTL